MASNSRGHRIPRHRGDGFGHDRIRATQQVVTGGRLSRNRASSGATASEPRTRPEDTAAGSNTHHGMPARAVFPDRVVMGLLNASSGARGDFRPAGAIDFVREIRANPFLVVINAREHGPRSRSHCPLRRAAYAAGRAKLASTD